MKFSVIAALAATASAAAIKRADVDAIFDVSSFEASCVPHSSQCIYSFKLAKSGTGETEGVSCSAYVTADSGNTLPAVENGTCEQSSRTWKIVKSTDGLALFASQQVTPASNVTGVHQINNSELEITTPENPNGAVQQYIGAPAFTLDRPQYE
ncbi:uncharacterized protein B0I36DRAFT_352706 [Microdochium trichocladiopsis]|uniref:Hypersensitive response-inducing protein n=1 Tax=Microdochium trichocladiopsis TaxID=1682393 RepID=A0A9P9BPE8_9PEZI|nr:uncharacterized protein B0I36DRAFT_352706 [Microdochium trichocladiopsis]KAH7024476.1 hypothetical protein B0I36DRAFT_352706 [Microdochium trichocladiopsis]